jgi:glyoxylase-like metal-dependent hydrolase (beta-lactamase superfamily II)
MSDEEPRIAIAIVPVTPFVQNCSVVKCTRTNKGAVVDPGGDLDEIRAAIAELDVNIEQILITHAHIDHAGGTAALARALSVPVIGPHVADQFWIDLLPSQGAMFGVEAAEIFVPDRLLADGDVVSVGELRFEVVHCPGHTPGHVVFFERKERVAFVGDVLFAGSIGRSDFPMGDHDALIASIREKLFPLGDDVTFVCGHGPTSTFGRERKTNPFVSDRAVGAR